MDPASLAIGAVSFTFQLFSGCVKAYKLISDANGMPDKYHYLRVRLKTEQHRLLNWAEVAELGEQHGLAGSTLRLNEHHVKEVLQEQYRILSEYGKAGDRYQLLVEDSQDGSTNMQKELDAQEQFPRTKTSLELRATSCIERLHQYPKRIRWAAFDRERFETLLAQLSALNDAMMSLLDFQQQLNLHRAQNQTFMKVVEMNNKIDVLMQISKAGGMSLYKTQFSDRLRDEWHIEPPAYASDPERDDAMLAKLAQFKALKIGLNPQEGTQISDSVGPALQPAEPLDAERCKVYQHPRSQGTADIERPSGTYDNEPVWIEWKEYDTFMPDGSPHPKMQLRISILAGLLSNPEKPALFQTPACAGYFHDVKNCRFGLVFRRPEGSSPEKSLTSLFDLMLYDEKPSLTARLRLAHTIATAVQYLHATNWLHKALSSTNVIFFVIPGSTDLSTPYLSGFGLSRPAQNADMTERPDTTPLHNLYRHPLAHANYSAEMTGGFKKAFDIYSLGIMLLELALWMPLHRVLDVEDDKVSRHFRPGVTQRVRGMLLANDKYINMVRGAAGDIYGDVVQACIGPMAEVGHDESEAFQGQVITMLEKLVV